MKNKKITSDTHAAVSCVEKLKARFARDVKRLKNRREVYTYRKDGVCSDNLLLFESSTKDVHGEVFKSWYQSFTDEEKKRYRGIEVIHVGTWDKLRYKFTPVNEIKIIFKG